MILTDMLLFCSHTSQTKIAYCVALKILRRDYISLGLIILVAIAWPLAFILTPFWLLLQPLEACCSLFSDINVFLERFVTCKYCINTSFLVEKEGFCNMTGIWNVCRTVYFTHGILPLSLTI